MNYSSSAQRFHFLALLVLCGLLFFPSLAKIPFFNKGEPREALVVLEIYQHGDWLFPLKRGEEIPSKPPLFHWFGTLASIAWGDVTEATVRLPSAVLASLGVLLIYILGRYIVEPKTAFLAGVILATSVGYQSEAINARVDMTLSFFMTLTLSIFFLLYQGFLRGRAWIYVFYLLLGLSVLAKGPVGLILPGMIMGVFLSLRRKWEFLSRLCFHKGAILCLAIPILWYGFAWAKGGEDFFARQILHENLARFFVYGAGGSGHQKPFYYYFPSLMLDGLPWSLFFPFVVFDWFKRRAFIQEPTLFLGLWVGIIFLFFSISAGKRPVYLLPLYGPLSLLVALWLLGGVENAVRSLGLKTVGWVSLIMGAVLLVAAWGILDPGHLSWFFSFLETMLKPKDQAQLSVVARNLKQAGWILVLSILLSAGLWFASALQLLRGKAWAAALSIGSISVLTGLLVQGALLPAVAEARTYKSFLQEVNRRLGRDGALFIWGEGWDYTSVIFYRRTGLLVLGGDFRPLQRQLDQSRGYCIMGQREWERIGSSRALPLKVVLTSEGSGPEGRDRIVLIQSIQAGEIVR